MIPRRILYSVGTSLFALLVVTLFHRPFTSFEDQFTAVKYSLRGAERADTNLVIVYIDNDAIKVLGWPVRRNFYALMIKALTDLRARAIGVDIVFEDPSTEYPEYDDLLGNMIASSGRVVLQSYFGSVGAEDRGTPGKVAAPPMFSYPQVGDQLQKGRELHLPLNKFAQGAAGIGHVNLVNEADIPLFLRTGDSVVPSFGMELLRVYKGCQRSDVAYGNRRVTLRSRGGEIDFCTSDDGVVRLNYPGGISSFTLFPFIDVLKSYDAQALHPTLLRERRGGSIPVARLKDKIVIIGVIAEGRGDFRYTPVDPRLPATVLHTVFLDDALRSGFLHGSGTWLVGALCLVVGLVCSGSVLFLSRGIAQIILVIFLVVTTGISFGLFMAWSYILPLSPLVFVGLVTAGGAFLFKHRLVQEQVDSLQAEQRSILTQLRDKEAKLAVLEKELLDVTEAKSKDSNEGLLEEIRRYKAEIRDLSSKADDMEEFRVEEGNRRPVTGEFAGIVYDTTGKMADIVEFVIKIAGSDAPVLILGESGTGKELVARALHVRSRRADKPFVAVNCGALAEGLLESELFGHEKGAFTGAVRDRPGRFELANGGTIFLDEIGEVSEAFQVKLLRVLQEGEFERVGATKTNKVDVRVIAATNKDLRQAVEEKRFRQDLYYRLNVLTIDLPPLRARKGDVPLLVEHFLRREGPGVRISRNVMDALQRYAWPGNIRELESVLKRAVLLASSDQRAMITMKDMTGEIAAAILGAVAVEEQILELLREKGFSRSSISDTAEELGGLNRGTVAEHLRGQCLQTFLEHRFDFEETVRHISLSTDKEVNGRVRKKLREYLSNLAEAIDTSRPWETTKAALQPKTKNLPQRYHSALETVAEAYFRGLWKSDK